MSLNKDSTTEDVCNFLGEFIKNQNIILKFKEERIKGNEIFYLENKDFQNLGYKLFKTKLLPKLNEIKNSQKDILSFNETIDENYTEEQVKNFLRKEMKFNEEIINKFNKINGKLFKKLSSDNLVEFGLKIGERKKLCKYLESIKDFQINNNSTTEELCTFLKEKFNLSEENLLSFSENEIDGESFLSYTENDFIDFNINDEETISNIMNYINNCKSNTQIEENKEMNEIILNNLYEVEEEQKEEQIYKQYFLIEIIEYITSEEEINKCPNNKLEDFIQLCEDMKIDSEDNCSKINFDQANDIKLKTVTLWGTKEGLFEFFEKKKMYKTIEYLNDEKNKNLSGIILSIKEDRSFAYIIVWPGKMSYIYKQLDEPQKGLLLSLVRIGFSLSDNSVICLSEQQINEFDYKAIKELNNLNAYKLTVGEVKFNDNNDFLKIEDKNIEIKFDSNELEGDIKDIKVNGSSVFIYIMTKDNIIYKSFNKITYNKLDFNHENILISEDFEMNEKDLDIFLKKFKCFSELLEEKKYIDINEYSNERIIEIQKLYRAPFKKYIERISDYDETCEICNNNTLKISGEDQLPSSTIENEKIYIYFCEEHGFHIIHLSCINQKKFDKTKNCFNNIPENSLYILDNKIKSIEKILNSLKKILINNSINLLNNIIEQYFEDFKKEENYLQKGNIIKKLEEIYNNIDDYIINNKKRILEEYITNYNIIKESSLNWKREIITEVNKIFNSKKETIDNWVYYERVNYDQSKNQYFFSYKIYKKQYSKCIVKLFTFYPYNNEEKFLLKFKDTNKWEEDDFENYFSKEKHGGLLIKNIDEFHVINFNNKIYKINGCYDYNNQSKIFIASHKKDSEKYEGFLIFHLDEKNNIINGKPKWKHNTSWNKTEKILLIPFKFENSYKYALFFHDKLITLMNIEDFRSEDFSFETYYNNYEKEKIKFIVHEKFLIVFYFKEIWKYDIYCINPDNKEFLQKLENENESESEKNELTNEKEKKNLESKQNGFNISSKDCNFSIFKIKNDSILYYCYFKEKNLILGSRKILTSSSHFTIESHDQNDIKEELNLTEGNCVLNYFYHAFKKYPSIGAVQYNYFFYNNKIIKKAVYLHSNNLKNIDSFEEYFKEIKNKCINERGLNYDINFPDLNYMFEGIYKTKNIKNEIGLGSLIIKFIEVIPIQIAKIKNYFFKAMSNGKDINPQDLFEKFHKKEISIQDKANYINFGLKNSIFNFYDLPVVVLVFMGIQSIGKSTLSNEIALSFFNVSGMRCTEGIWMAISLFQGINENIKKCDDKCKYCSKKECDLYEHNKKIFCICKDCWCGETCTLYHDESNIKINQNICKIKCRLPKNHKEKEHICQISPYNHGFICVSLDFEGLGTFERSLEQDIDLAMVGAAMGNSIILRVDKTFDKFLESRMLNWSEGSKNINTTKSLNYFGGNLIFCQKDVIKDNVKEVQKEFDEKINNSLRAWLDEEKKRNIRELDLNNLPIFGIFSKFINSPTPIFNQKEFHSFLKNELTNSLIKDVLVKKSLPIYRTGYEFMNSLKIILATVDIHDYNVLDSIKIDNLKNYISENKDKAIEIFGVYSTIKMNFTSFEEFENNIKSNLESLKFSFISNAKQKIEKELNFEIFSKNPIIAKKELKFEDLNISIKVSSYNTHERCLSPNINIKNYKSPNIKKYNNLINDIDNKNHLKLNKNLIFEKMNKLKLSLNSFNLKIEGINEFGLLLLIPFDYKENFNLEDIRKKLFSIWKLICEKINLLVPEIIDNFSFFINALINRRERNIKNWIFSLTSSFQEETVKSLRNNVNCSLKEKWIICREKCSFCFYKCTKILGHPNEHNCGFDHICHEKCQKCELVDCNDFTNCDHFCYNKKAGHKNAHLCAHFHQCTNPCSKNNLRQCAKICKLEFGHKGECLCDSLHLCDKDCIYKNNSQGCKINCCLEFNHKGEHKCESNEHRCCLPCSLKDKSKGCINGGICNLKLPHPSNYHDCRGDHKCIEECHLKNLSKNCGGECSHPFGHKGDHICREIHKCKEKCEFHDKARGCKIECSLDYGHQSSHKCSEQHYCNKQCYYYNKSISCINNGICGLSYEHEDKCKCGVTNHFCNELCTKGNCENRCSLFSEHKDEYHDCGKEFHQCDKKCSLYKESRENTCNSNCINKFGHKGDCFCNNPKEKHICKNKCKNCNKDCKLITGHEGKCICGECRCKDNCRYQNSSHNCKKKCKELFGHTGPHICEVKIHLCNHECIYKSKTREKGGCTGYCHYEMGHDPSIMHCCETKKENHICAGNCSLFGQSKYRTCDHFCNRQIDHMPPCLCRISVEKHICNKECSLKGKKGCNNTCILSVNHNGDCLCSTGKDGHLCNKECTYFKITSKGCKTRCILRYDHPEDQPCKCSADLESHLHKGDCYLKPDSREGCSHICNYPINHEGPCLCQYSIDQHLCNKICHLSSRSSEDSCKKNCIYKAGHDGQHICDSQRHECNEPCKFKDFSISGCLGHCYKEVGHKSFFSKNEHICQNSKENHKCKGDCCHKNNSRGCNGNCDKQVQHKGEHLCNSKVHLCNEKCFYNDKCKMGCKQICSKMLGHKDKHDCGSEAHFCKKICHFQNSSRGCCFDCSLFNGHDGICICKKKEYEHLCIKKCELCKDDCCNKVNHNGDHLCNKEHECKKQCEEDGWCEIITNTNIDINKNKKTYIIKKTNQQIEYTENSKQTHNRKNCIIKIPSQILAHIEKHKCDIIKHKCGFACKQCNRLCELDYGHSSFHYCKHGQIKNSFIQTEEESISINFLDKEYTFGNKEEAIMFSCYQYCRDQKRGHVHRISSKDIVDLEGNLKNGKIRKMNDDLYECKCEYFWKIFLFFRFENEFDKNLIKEFSMCPAKCKICLNNNKNTFCDLNLWHENSHNFNCGHSELVPFHTIFIIDKSYSMSASDITPNCEKLKRNGFNNRLGCVIHVIDNYVKKRLNINNNDIFSFVAFNSGGKIIFQNYNYKRLNSLDLIDECMKLIGAPDGGTRFLEGFKRAKDILFTISKKEYKPVMILLSDGEDGYPERTIEYIKENVSIINL